MQAAGVTIGESIEIWLDLLEGYPTCYKAAKKKIQARSCDALENPLFLLGNILDPRFRGRRLTAAQHALAKNYERDLGLMDSYLRYLAQDFPFLPAQFEDPGQSYRWWAAGAASGYPADLSDFALRLAASEATSASLERLFSNLRHIYGNLRTNLGAEKAGMMALVYRFLNPKLRLRR